MLSCNTETCPVVLIGGNGNSSGNVYVTNRNGFYGPVCDDGWTDTEATVVCRCKGSLQRSKVNQIFSSDNLDSTPGHRLLNRSLEVFPQPLQWTSSPAL